MLWNVFDSLYHPSALFASHLDSYSHYLREAGEEVRTRCINFDLPEVHDSPFSPGDVLFMLDAYDLPTRAWGKVRIAQVAAMTSPMPWEVKDATGAPMYHCVISSIPWMVEAARAAGCRAEYMPLAFDTRARVAGMGVKRDLGCIFVGSVGSNHRRRTQLLEELKDVVTVMPPVFGREYFRTLARARVVLNVHAEWSRGAANNMRMFEATGMGAALVTDGDFERFWPADNESNDCVWAVDRKWIQYSEFSPRNLRTWLEGFASAGRFYGGRTSWGEEAQAITLREHTYESRVSELVALSRSL